MMSSNAHVMRRWELGGANSLQTPQVSGAFPWAAWNLPDCSADISAQLRAPAPGSDATQGTFSFRPRLWQMRLLEMDRQAGLCWLFSCFLDRLKSCIFSGILLLRYEARGIASLTPLPHQTLFILSTPHHQLHELEWLPGLYVEGDPKPGSVESGSGI